MSNKKQTPLQEAIQRVKRAKYINPVGNEHHFNQGIKEAVNLLKEFLPKEQQTFSDIWDAGYSKCHAKHCLSVEQYKNTPDKTEFLNQYKPEP